jgi:hypothetical protein
MSNFYIQANSPQVIAQGNGINVNGGASPILTTSLSLLLPANTLKNGDLLQLYGSVERIAGGTGSMTTRVYINTTNSLSGALLIGAFQNMNINTYNTFTRSFYFDGTNIINATSGSVLANDYSSVARGSFTYNSTLNYYFLFAIVPVANSVGKYNKAILMKW